MSSYQQSDYQTLRAELGATLYVKGETWTSFQSKFYADAATLRFDTLYVHNDNETKENEVIVSGANAFIQALNDYTTRGKFGDRLPGQLTFEIPVGGYGEDAPVRGCKNKFMRDSGAKGDGTQGSVVKVSKKSPAFKSGKEFDQCLIANGGFGTIPEGENAGKIAVFLDSSELPENCYYFYTDKDGNKLSVDEATPANADKLWVHVKGQSTGFVVIVL